MLIEGSFTFYVDRILGFFDPYLPPCRQFIQQCLFTCIDISITPTYLSSVYVDCERPLRIPQHSLASLSILQRFQKLHILCYISMCGLACAANSCTANAVLYIERRLLHRRSPPKAVSASRLGWQPTTAEKVQSKEFCSKI